MVRSDIVELGAVDIGHPGQIVLDDVLDRVAGGDEIGGHALGFVVAERFLLADEAVEARLEVAHRDAQRHDGILLRDRQRSLDAVEASHRHRLAVVEILDLGIGRPRDEVGRRGAHNEEPGLEIAAGVGHFGVAMHGLEGVADVEVAGYVSEAIGEEADNRNDAEHDDAGAYR